MPRKRRAASPKPGASTPTAVSSDHEQSQPQFAVESAAVQNALSSLVLAIQEDNADSVVRIAQLQDECERLRSGRLHAAPMLSAADFMTVVSFARAGQYVHRHRLVGGLYSKLSTKQSPLAAEKDCQEAAIKVEEQSWWCKLVEEHKVWQETEPATDGTYEAAADLSPNELAHPDDAMVHTRLVAQIIRKAGANASVLEQHLQQVSVAVLTLILDVLDHSGTCPHCP